MAAGTGISGFGTTLKTATASTSLTGASALGELRDFSGPEGSAGGVDITHNTSPSGVREFVAKLRDWQEVSIDGVWTYGAWTTLKALFVAGTKTYWRVQLPAHSGTTASMIDIYGHMSKLGVMSPMDDAVQMPIGIKVSGDITVATT